MKRHCLVVSVACLAMCLSAVRAAEKHEQFHWEHAGYGGGGGFYASAWHPSNPNVIYMGGDVNGMVKTDDKGLNWRLINRGITCHGIYSIAIAKSSPETVYILGSHGGMCKSTDGGEHWQSLCDTAFDRLNITGQAPWTVRAVAVDPTNADIVYAGSVATDQLYKSTDGGTTWKQLDIEHATPAEVPLEKKKLTAPEPKKAAAKPKPGSVRHDGITELGTWDQGKALMSWTSDNSHPFVTGVKVTKEINSTGKKNKGGSLELSCDGDARLTPPVGWARLHFGAGRDWSRAEKVTAKFYLPADAPVLDGQLSVICSVEDKWKTDSGPQVAGKPGEWVDVVLDLSAVERREAVKMLVFAVYAPKSEYIGKVYLDDVLLYGEEKGSEAAAATDGSKARGVPGTGNGPNAMTGPAISSVAVAEKNPKFVMATSSQRGVLRSTDGGESWTQVRAAPAAWSVSIAPSNPDIVYCCYNNDEQMLRSSDGGRTWRYINEGVPLEYTTREIAVDPTNPDHIYTIGFIGWGGAITYSNDGGKTWAPLIKHVIRDLSANPTHPDKATDGSTDFNHMNRGNNISVNPNNPDEVHIACGWAPPISLDGGKTWYERDRGADITCTADVCFLPGGKVYLGAMDQGMMLSEDNGAHWKQLFPLNPRMDIEESHVWRVWAGDDGRRIVGLHQPLGANGNHVDLSEDGGKTFSRITRRLPGQQPQGPSAIWGKGAARGLAVDPQNPDVMYLSIDGDNGGGIYKSTDGGKSWAAIPRQPPSRRSWMGLHLDPTDPNRIYYGTTGTGGGLYRSDDGGNSWKLAFKGDQQWIMDFGISPSGVVYCGDKNLSKSTDHGETWTKLTNFEEEEWHIASVEIDQRKPERIWISRFPAPKTKHLEKLGGIWQTIDGGKTWQEITGDHPEPKVYGLRLNPYTNELWTVGVGLFKLAVDTGAGR
jgi:photosystem II stability/assembly factor-like uncharacterized protein